jgi:hypothetical protein
MRALMIPRLTSSLWHKKTGGKVAHAGEVFGYEVRPQSPRRLLTIVDDSGPAVPCLRGLQKASASSIDGVCSLGCSSRCLKTG